MLHPHTAILLWASLLLGSACNPSGTHPNDDYMVVPDVFPGEYWFDGQAELNLYSLRQERYGELRDGHAVLIYVTEDISRAKHVKFDRTPADNGDVAKVLKLNRINRFETGVYDYSVFTSVFQPLGATYPLKIVMSSQDWCGQSFAQVNRRGTNLDFQQRNYFESSADIDKTHPAEWMEDGIWTQLRTDPASLPEGSFLLYPSLEYVRMRHLPFEITAGTASWTKTDTLWTYHLEMPVHERVLHWDIEPEAPWRLRAWRVEEGGRVSEGRLQNQIRNPYWQHNRVADSLLRRDFFSN
jgi:hypothetical protein